MRDEGKVELFTNFPKEKKGEKDEKEKNEEND